VRPFFSSHWYSTFITESLPAGIKVFMNDGQNSSRNTLKNNQSEAVVLGGVVLPKNRQFEGTYPHA
jgi:hypothetical protein